MKKKNSILSRFWRIFITIFPAIVITFLAIFLAKDIIFLAMAVYPVTLLVYLLLDKGCRPFYGGTKEVVSQYKDSHIVRGKNKFFFTICSIGCPLGALFYLFFLPTLITIAIIAFIGASIFLLSNKIKDKQELDSLFYSNKLGDFVSKAGTIDIPEKRVKRYFEKYLKSEAYNKYRFHPIDVDIEKDFQRYALAMYKEASSEKEYKYIANIIYSFYKPFPDWYRKQSLFVFLFNFNELFIEIFLKIDKELKQNYQVFRKEEVEKKEIEKENEKEEKDKSLLSFRDGNPLSLKGVGDFSELTKKDIDRFLENLKPEKLQYYYITISKEKKKIVWKQEIDLFFDFFIYIYENSLDDVILRKIKRVFYKSLLWLGSIDKEEQKYLSYIKMLDKKKKEFEDKL
ncbi:hypothetical protein EOL94_04115 [bacterium]|nr:hypothetical protein [bacterium]